MDSDMHIPQYMYMCFRPNRSIILPKIYASIIELNKVNDVMLCIEHVHTTVLVCAHKHVKLTFVESLLVVHQ